MPAKRPFRTALAAVDRELGVTRPEPQAHTQPVLGPSNCLAEYSPEPKSP